MKSGDIRIPYMICIINTEEAKRLGFKIIGSAGSGVYAGKSLVHIQAYLK